MTESPLRQRVGNSIRGIAYQWPAWTAFVLAVCLLGVTLLLRLRDESSPQIAASALDSQTIGVFTDLDARVALDLRPNPAATANAVYPSDRQFKVDITPGTPMLGQVYLVLLDNPGIWNLVVSRPVHLIVVLPKGSTLTDQGRTLIASPESRGACAAWYAGGHYHFVRPTDQTSIFGDRVVSCDIPAFGAAEYLFVELPFSWRDKLRGSTGFSRFTSSIRVGSSYSMPTDVHVQAGFPVVAEKTSLRIHLPPGDQLTDAFPSPTGGQHDQRWWDFERGGDVDYTIETPSGRIWVQPAIDLSLLVAGAFLGLIPAARRKPRPAP